MPVLSRKSILVLDGLLLIATLLLLAPRFTGMRIHECLGIALLLPVLLHLLISWDWIRDTARRLFGDATARQRFNFLLNTVLFVLIVLEIVSGIVISHAALPTLKVHLISDRAWRGLHNRFLGWLRLIVGCHIAMNWTWIASNVRRWGTLSHRVEQSGPVAWIGRSALLLTLAAIVAGAEYWWLGPPSPSRIYRIDEVAAFAGAYSLGALQITLQILLQVMIVYIARRWLRVRL